MGGGDDLEFLLGEGLFNLLDRGGAADGAVELGDVGAVLGQAVGEAVAKVARAQDQGVLAGLDQVGRDQVPAQGAGAVDDEGLGVGVGGLDDLAEEGEGLAKGLDEASADVALAVVVEVIVSSSWHSRSKQKIEGKKRHNHRNQGVACLAAQRRSPPPRLSNV